MTAPDHHTEDGELLCQHCGDRPAVGYPLDDPANPAMCQRCLDRAHGKPEPPTDAEIERAQRRMELLIGKDWLEGKA